MSTAKPTTLPEEVAERLCDNIGRSLIGMQARKSLCDTCIHTWQVESLAVEEKDYLNDKIEVRAYGGCPFAQRRFHGSDFRNFGDSRETEGANCKHPIRTMQEHGGYIGINHVVDGRDLDAMKSVKRVTVPTAMKAINDSMVARRMKEMAYKMGREEREEREALIARKAGSHEWGEIVTAMSNGTSAMTNTRGAMEEFKRLYVNRTKPGGSPAPTDIYEWRGIDWDHEADKYPMRQPVERKPPPPKPRPKWQPDAESEAPFG